MQTQSRIPFTLDDYFALVVEAKTHTVQTGKAYEVIIFTTIANGNQPVVGQIDMETSISRWNADGCYDMWGNAIDIDKDLVIVKKGPKSLGWINVYEFFAGTSSREQADQYAQEALGNGHKRIACIEVFEGQGIDEPTINETK